MDLGPVHTAEVPYPGPERRDKVPPHTMNQKSNQNIKKNSCFEGTFGRLPKIENFMFSAGMGDMAQVPYPGHKMDLGPGHMAEVPYPGLKMDTGPGYMAEVPYPGHKINPGLATWPKSHTLGTK